MLVKILKHSHEGNFLATSKFNLIAKINNRHPSIFITEDIRNKNDMKYEHKQEQKEIVQRSVLSDHISFFFAKS